MGSFRGGGGGGHSTFFQVGVCGPDFRSVGSGVDPGGMGGYIPPIFDQGGGDGLCNHPPQSYASLMDGRHALNITSSISSRPTIYPWKTGSFYASISRWVITYCFDINVKICNVLICLELIKMLPKSIHQIAPFSFQNSKIFQLLKGGGSFSGGHIPPQTPPCARKRAIGANAPPDHPPQCSRVYTTIYVREAASGKSLSQL